MARRLLALSLTVLMMTAPVVASAAQKGDHKALRAALTLFKQGSTAFKAKDFDAALKLFRKAQATYEHEPLIILALAKTLDGAGEVTKALRYYQLFIREAEATDRDRKPTLARIAVIKKQLAARPATIVLKGMPTGATLKIDGKLAQVDPRNAVRVAAGVHSIHITMGNRVPFSRRFVSVAAGQRLQIDVILMQPVDQSRLPRDHTWTWVAGGTAAVAALAVGVIAIRGVSLRNEYGELFDLETGAATAAARQQYGCKTNKDSDCPELLAEGKKLKAAIGDNDMLVYATAITAGAASIATIVAFVAAPIKPRAASSQALRVTPTWDGRRPGVALSLRF
ncbi:MAG: hypothetical protein KC502_05230 [Myxococcales bacterium]|nr:hypothetical protein [Myxococcales bacterium]